jgi:hypothetical protein
MTARTALTDLIGRTVSIPAGQGNIQYQAVIADAKTSYGVDRVLIRPVSGKGEAWVNADKIAPHEREK